MYRKFVTALILALLNAGVAFSQTPGSARQETGARISRGELQDLEQRLRNLEVMVTWQHDATSDRVFKRDISRIHRYYNRYYGSVSEAELINILRRRGWITSGAATWGRESIQRCLDSGLLVGRYRGTTADSPDWNKPMSRREGAALGDRLEQRRIAGDQSVKEYVDEKVGGTGVQAPKPSGSTKRVVAPPAPPWRFWEKWNVDWASFWPWLLWGLLILLIAYLVYRLIMWAIGLANRPPTAPAPPPAPGPAPAPAPAPVPGPAPAPAPGPTPGPAPAPAPGPAPGPPPAPAPGP